MQDEDLRKAQAEFIVLIKAFDDTFSQSIYQRTSYIAGEVQWGVRFTPMTSPGADGVLEMDVDRLDATEAAGVQETAPG
jgi:inward rectifier potassium channel